MSMMQRSSFGYEPPADKLYDQPLLGFVRTKNAHTEKQQNQLPQNTVEATLNLQNKCSLEDNTEGEEDGAWHEGDPKLGPEERKAARKEHEKKVKEEKREARKTKKNLRLRKKRTKMPKAKCKRQ